MSVCYICQQSAALTCAHCNRPVCKDEAKGSACKYCAPLFGAKGDETRSRAASVSIKKIAIAVIAVLVIGGTGFFFYAQHKEKKKEQLMFYPEYGEEWGTLNEQTAGLLNSALTESVKDLNKELAQEQERTTSRPTINTSNWRTFDFGAGTVRYPQSDNRCLIEIDADATVCLNGNSPYHADFVISTLSYADLDSDDWFGVCGVNFDECKREEQGTELFIEGKNREAGDLSGYEFYAMEPHSNIKKKTFMLDIGTAALYISQRTSTQETDKLYETILSTLKRNKLQNQDAPESADVIKISNINMLRTSLELYRSFAGKDMYPSSGTENQMFRLGKEVSCIDANGFGNNCDKSAYMKTIPNDPLADEAAPNPECMPNTAVEPCDYAYKQINSGADYEIWFWLDADTADRRAGLNCINGAGSCR